jgi:N-acetylglucosaminyldiphosphoundecaprenol N-acetyl-beta-D-mannosaminyltransferase
MALDLSSIVHDAGSSTATKDQRATGQLRTTATSVRILGVRVMDETMEGAIDRARSAMDSAGPSSLFFVNAHTLNLATADPTYRRLLNEAEMVFGDGTGVRWAARPRGVEMKANVNGTDLVPALLARADGARCYLLGNRSEVVERAAEHVRRTYPDVAVVGCHHGFLDEEASARLVETINGLDVDLLLVGMGNPHQEQWIARHRPRLRARLCVGVGGLFNYLADEIDRAPLWMRRAGIEWMHVLRRHPWKLRRYLLGNPLFLARMLLWLPADLRRRRSSPDAEPFAHAPAIKRS